jgi:membrane-bound lytic murein transglycosylase B
VKVFTLVRLRRRRLAAVGGLCAALVMGVPALVTPARADTSTDASAKVQSLLSRVHSLQAQVKAAEGKYTRAFGAVADSVNVAITADQASSSSAARVATAQAALVARVRGLYESGGQLAADVAVLGSGNISDLYDRNELASRALGAQMASLDSATVAASTAVTAARRAQQREQLKIGTERTVAVAANRVESLLAQQQALLKQANHHLAAVQSAATALAAETSTFSALTSSGIAALHVLPPSAQYLALYKAAAPTCPGLSWTVLAAIGQVESGHGRNLSTSSAGAAGPMQFEPGTFAAYAVDGDHDGTASIMSPADAIFTAAHYLCADGAGHSPAALADAILHYNHAVWYVQMVLKLSEMYASQYG